MKGRGPGKYTRRKVAIVKAAARVLPFKTVARLSGVPYLTVRTWMMGFAHKDVEPDPTFNERFAYLARRLFY